MAMDLWLVVSDVPALADRQGHSDSGRVPAQLMVRALQNIAIGGSFSAETAEGLIVLHPREGVRPDDLAALVRGAIAGIRLGDLPEEARKQLEKIDVHEDGGVVTIEGSISRELIESFGRR
jgi:hypothetical protein